MDASERLIFGGQTKDVKASTEPLQVVSTSMMTQRASVQFFLTYDTACLSGHLYLFRSHRHSHIK
jgi:hypothetical protein